MEQGEAVRRREAEKRKNEARRRRQKKRKRQQMFARSVMVLTGTVFVGVILYGGWRLSHRTAQAQEEIVAEETKYIADRPDFSVELLDYNEYSRPGTALEKVNGIVVHYTANPGTTAQQNRDYFEGLAQSGETHASSHFVIGISGEIIQCIPCNEIAYASNDRNSDTVSIECCIPDDTGKFTDATYGSLVHLVTWLMGRYDLTTDDVIRHYDVTGKACPKYYVENEAAWEQFKSDLVDYIETRGNTVKWVYQLCRRKQYDREILRSITKKRKPPRKPCWAACPDQR